MAILPEGFALPPLPYLAVLLAGTVLVAGVVYRRRPTVSPERILAFTPWMVLGSAGHVLYVIDALPDPLRPLAGTPSVYLTVGLLGVSTWLAADAVDGPTVPRVLAFVGGSLAVAAIGGVLALGSAGGLAPGAPLAALVVAALVAAAVWVALTRFLPEVRRTGALGGLAVVAHVLDGVSTAVGIDVLGFGERTPLSRLVVEFAAGLPTAPTLGAGWLFVLVKIAVISLVVWLFADLITEEPTEAQLLLGFVAAVGLGPAIHNLLLFTVTTPA